MKNRNEAEKVNAMDDMDTQFLKLTNRELSKSLSDARIEIANLTKKINYLNEERFDLQSNLNYMKNVVVNIENTSKVCLTKMVDLTNSFTCILQSCAVANAWMNKEQAVTHAVKPSIVNGHILQNPVIRLTRIGNQNNENTSNDRNEAPADEETVEDDDNAAEHNDSFQCRSGSGSVSRLKVSLERLDKDLLESLANGNEEDEEEDGQQSDSANSGDNERKQLTIIEEEEEENISRSLNRSRPFSGVHQEVKIYLNQCDITDNCDRKRKTTVTPRKTLNETFSSTSANVSSPLENNSILNERDEEDEENVNKIKKTSNKKSGSSDNSSHSSSANQTYSQNQTVINQGFDDLNISQIQVLKGLGLTPTSSSGSRTSTPIDFVNRRNSRTKSKTVFSSSLLQNSSSFDNSSKLSLSNTCTPNRSSRVTKRRRNIDDTNKMPSVILNRLSLEMFNSDGTVTTLTSENITKDLTNQNVRPSRDRNSPLTVRRKPVPLISSDEDDDADTESTTSKASQKNSPIPSRRKRVPITSEEDNDHSDIENRTSKVKRKKSKIVKKSIVNEALPSETTPISSPNGNHQPKPHRKSGGRPRRAARPNQPLVEPSLNKKMRRE